MSNSNGNHSGQPSVRIRRERKYRPVEAGAFHILTHIAAPVVINPDRQRPPLDLAFVVDRSGSMSGGALDLARRGVEHVLQLLDERDSISLVVYDDAIDTLLTQRPFDRLAHDKAVLRLRRVQPRGSTDLAGGWLTGCDQLAPIADGSRVMRHDRERAIVRALLLSDGLANVGVTDPQEIAHHAAELGRRGISTSTFGVGDHYDEDLLAGMADAGRGRFHHIANPRDIARVFAGELGEMLEVAMRDATISLRLPSSWRVHLLNDLPLDHHDGWLTLRLGELASRESRALLWVIDLPDAPHGSSEAFDIRLRWTDADGLHRCERTLSHTVEARLNPGHPDVEVQDELARFIGARARAEAVRHNKAGRYDLAQAAIQHSLAYLPQTEAGREVAMELSEEVMPMMARPASRADLKRQFARARNTQRSQRDYTER